MAYFVLGIFFVAAMLFIMHPLFASRRHIYYLEGIYDSDGEKQLALMNAKKQLISDNVVDLEFERQMGKLSEEDFERLHDGYEREADKVNRSIAAFKAKQEIDDFIENEIQTRRKLK